MVTKLLLMTPFRSHHGLCIFQKWSASFDPAAERGPLGDLLLNMRIPTWITLRKLPDKFRGVAKQIAAGLEDVLGEDAKNAESYDP